MGRGRPTTIKTPADLAVTRTEEVRDDVMRAGVKILILGMAPAVGLGIARFAYALLLPDMRESLGWSYAEAGFMNTANAAGYLGGALTGALLVSRLGAFRAVAAGAFACILALVTLALTHHFILLSAARIISGFAAAYAFVGGGLLATRIARCYPSQQSLLLSLFYVGPGVGFVLSGAFIPPILENLGPGSWQTGWAALATIAAVLAAMLPFAGRATAVADVADSHARMRLADKLPFLAGYLLYGAGISAYLTFIVAWLRETGQPSIIQAATWTCLGAGALVAPWLWQRAVMNPRGGRGASLVIAANAAGAVVPLLAATPAALMLSALVVGSACFTVVAATTAYVRRNFPESLWSSGIAAMTCMFGLGQIAGPIAAGALTDETGTLAPAVWMSAILLASGAVLARLQREIVQATNQKREDVNLD